MGDEELSALIRELEHSSIREAGTASQANDIRWKAAKALDSLSASLANAERRAEEAESRNEFFERLVGLSPDRFEEVRKMVEDIFNLEGRRT